MQTLFSKCLKDSNLESLFFSESALTFPPHSVPSSTSLILFLESIPFSPFSIYFSQLRFLSSLTYYMRLLTPCFKSLCPLPLLPPIFLTQLTVSSHSENQSCGFHTSNQNMEVLDHCYSQNAIRRFAPYSNQMIISYYGVSPVHLYVPAFSPSGITSFGLTIVENLLIILISVPMPPSPGNVSCSIQLQ